MRRAKCRETRAELNPKWIPTQSPGLRGTSYPGEKSFALANPERVVSPSGVSPAFNPYHNPFRVDPRSPALPRVAHSSQPWAGGHNPFGIEYGSEPQLLLDLVHHRRRWRVVVSDVAQMVRDTGLGDEPSL